MKFLAIEEELLPIDATLDAELLREEARAVLHLQHEGTLREIYFDDGHCAVLVLECADADEAGRVLDTLPLVRAGRIRFTRTALHPYTGFSRLFV
jgi:muconolactone delta-isomerase